MLRIASEVLAELERWARASYPHEACALLIGGVREGEGRVAAVRLARNLEERRAQERFDLHPADHLAAERMARALGLAVVGLWHTHPDRPARPSAEDRAAAAEGWVHLISSLGEVGAMESRAWLLRGARCVELRLEIEIGGIERPASGGRAHSP